MLSLIDYNIKHKQIKGYIMLTTTIAIDNYLLPNGEPLLSCVEDDGFFNATNLAKQFTGGISDLNRSSLMKYLEATHSDLVVKKGGRPTKLHKTLLFIFIRHMDYPMLLKLDKVLLSIVEHAVSDAPINFGNITPTLQHMIVNSFMIYNTDKDTRRLVFELQDNEVYQIKAELIIGYEPQITLIDLIDKLT